jgi:AcrR family transcriptional regulator
MTKVVDPQQRRREIAQVALGLLSSQGLRGLTMRALAREMNGSMTMVTHYYDSRAEVLRDLAHQLSLAWREELADLEGVDADPRTRLRTVLEWMLPVTDESRMEERARFALLTAQDDPDCVRVLREFDTEMRAVLRAHLLDLVPAARLDSATSYIRAITNGVVLDDYLDPEAWPAEKQHRLCDDVIAWIDFLASS